MANDNTKPPRPPAEVEHGPVIWQPLIQESDPHKQRDRAERIRRFIRACKGDRREVLWPKLAHLLHIAGEARATREALRDATKALRAVDTDALRALESHPSMVSPPDEVLDVGAFVEAVKLAAEAVDRAKALAPPSAARARALDWIDSTPRLTNYNAEVKRLLKANGFTVTAARLRDFMQALQYEPIRDSVDDERLRKKWDEVGKKKAPKRSLRVAGRRRPK